MGYFYQLPSKHLSAPSRFAKSVEENLRHVGAQRDLGGVLEEWCVKNPVVKCEACDGLGVKPGEDPRSGSGSCPVCRGFRERRLSADEIRAAYKALRDPYCMKKRISNERFDKLAKKRVPKEGAMPGHWLAAAKDIISKGRR